MEKEGMDINFDDIANYICQYAFRNDITSMDKYDISTK
jgi:hypothetical protein